MFDIGKCEQRGNIWLDTYLYSSFLLINLRVHYQIITKICIIVSAIIYN